MAIKLRIFFKIRRTLFRLLELTIFDAIFRTKTGKKRCKKLISRRFWCILLHFTCFTEFYCM